jgi:hypothetical protein
LLNQNNLELRDGPVRLSRFWAEDKSVVSLCNSLCGNDASTAFFGEVRPGSCPASE